MGEEPGMEWDKCLEWNGELYRMVAISGIKLKCLDWNGCSVWNGTGVVSGMEWEKCGIEWEKCLELNGT